MRKLPKAFWPYIVIILVVAPSLYVLLFGVSCWTMRGKGDDIATAFWAAGWTVQKGPRACRAPILWYAKLGIGDGEPLVLPASADGRHRLILEKGKPGFLQVWGPAPE